MHQRVLALHVHHVPSAQPIEKLVPVRRRQHCVQCVAPMQLAKACSHREQMQVVISQGGDRCVAERHGAPEHGERFGATIHQITHQPQPVA